MAAGVLEPTRATPDGVAIERDAPIPTWFRIGGRADALARPRDVSELLACVRMEPRLRVLGDGANLLVDDDGVGELVVALDAPAFKGWEIDAARGLVRVGAGANLPKLINETVRLGLAGIETLGGIPATIGGALVMNAGGAFGQIADTVARVFALDRAGREVMLSREQIPFSYRHSGLEHLILTGAELKLTPGDPATVRDRLKEIMRYKSGSQPMAADSAGCCFKNPTLAADVPELLADLPTAVAGARVSAGMLIDRAGCKGMRIGGAQVSERHANFFVTHPGATARDVQALMAAVTRRVIEAFGVMLVSEVVVWRRGS